MKKSGPKDTGTEVVVVPLEQARAVAKPKPVKFRDFKRFVAEVDELVANKKDLLDLYHGKSKSTASGEVEEFYGEDCDKLVAKCKSNLERFDRRENYEDPDNDESPLRQDYIAKRVGIMVASFPNANPSSPEGYLQMLVEHLFAVDGLTQIALESACREIVETQKFAPAISEVLEVVDEQISKWSEHLNVIFYDFKGLRRELIDKLMKREQEEREEAIWSARKQLENAISWRKECMQKIEEAWTEAGVASNEMFFAEMFFTEPEDEEVKAEAKAEWEAAAKAAQAKIAVLKERHARCEEHESECMRKLKALTATEEEIAAAAEIKTNGAGTAELFAPASTSE